MDEDLKEMPQYLGEHETKSKIRVLPSIPGKMKPEKDTINLTALLSTPIECQLTLGELLRVRTNLWNELAKTLHNMGIKGIQNEHIKQLKGNHQTPTSVQPVPLNKVGDYCEGLDGNITLPIEYNDVKTLAILDSGVGVAIATKHFWEKWGKPTIRKTHLKLQLADGHLEPALGLLEGISITTCVIKFIHTFVVVDFGRKIAYDIILGRPFMRQIKMLQDWGSNHLYLRHANVITRVSTIDNSYKDFRETPIQEYDSITSQSRVPA